MNQDKTLMIEINPCKEIKKIITDAYDTEEKQQIEKAKERIRVAKEMFMPKEEE